MNLPLCRKENRKNEPKTAQSGGFLCKMTKKSQKIRHFDRAPTFVSAGISAFWHFCTIFRQLFVQNYLLTNSRNYVIIVSESEGNTMGDAMLIGFIGFIIVTIISDFFMNRY